MSRTVAAENVRERGVWNAVSLPAACSACWLVFGITVLVADRFSGNPEWWRYSICAFGAAEKSRAPWLFNTGVLATSVLMVMLAAREHEILAPSCRRGIVTAWERSMIVGVTLILALQLAVVGLVPYDLSPTARLVHNLAGWGGGSVLTLGMLSVALASRDFGRSFRVMTWLMLAAVFTLFMLFELSALPYAIAEVAGLSCCAVWTIRYFSALDELAER